MTTTALFMAITGALRPVVAAATTKSVVQTTSTGTSGTATITYVFPATCTAGNLIVLSIRQDDNYFPTLPLAGWTTLADTGTAAGTTRFTRMAVIAKISDGTEKTITITSGSSAYTGIGMEVAGATAANAYALAVGTAARSGVTFFCPSVTPTAGSTLAIGYGGSTTSASGITYTAPSGWTLTAYDNVHTSYNSGAAYKLQDSSMSAVSMTLTTSVAQSSNACSITLLLQ